MLEAAADAKEVAVPVEDIKALVASYESLDKEHALL